MVATAIVAVHVGVLSATGVDRRAASLKAADGASQQLIAVQDVRATGYLRIANTHSVETATSLQSVRSSLRQQANDNLDRADKAGLRQVLLPHRRHGLLRLVCHRWRLRW